MPITQIKNSPSNLRLKKAIVFVHGLNGSAETWTGSPARWIDRLNTEPEINQHFDFFMFTYGTKIFDPFNFYKKILALIPGKKRKPFNVEIWEISNELLSAVTNVLASYDVIILISHSMGGLVCKQMLVNIGPSINKIPLLISLSVPHMGAHLAVAGKELFRNPQLVNLATFSSFTTRLNQQYAQIPNGPKIIYQNGTQDQVVPGQSAVPPGTLIENRIDTGDTHFSVLLIEDANTHSPYVRVLKELRNIIQQHGSCEAINVPITIDLPAGITFKEAIKTLLYGTGATFKLEGFADDENYILEGGKLIRPNTFEALRSLAFQNNTIPDYNVELQGCHFIITKTN